MRSLEILHVGRRRRVGSWVASETGELLNPATVGTARYRYRGVAILAPWPATAA